MIPNLNPESNPDHFADPDLVANLDPVANGSGMVQIRLPNLCQDKFSNKSGSVFIFDDGYNSGSK
jgi:hypothetical protein